MVSNIWVAVMTGLPTALQDRVIIFWARPTCASTKRKKKDQKMKAQ